MKIDRQQRVDGPAGAGRVGSTRPPTQAERTTGTTGAPSVDHVVLSSRTLQVSELQPVLEALPAARADMIQQLKERIARREYSVEPHTLAESLLRAKVIEE